MGFGFFQFKCLFDKRRDRHAIEVILARIDVCREETAFRKGMNTDVAPGDNEESAPATGIFGMPFRCPENERFCQRAHPQLIAELAKDKRYRFLTVETFRIPSVSVNRYVFAEMSYHDGIDPLRRIFQKTATPLL